MTHHVHKGQGWLLVVTINVRSVPDHSWSSWFTPALPWVSLTSCSASHKKRNSKKPLDENERGEWKSWLKAQHSENEDMASGPITSWQIDGETMKTVADYIFLGSKITADGDCSHELKRCLLLGRKVMTNLDNILKSRDITFQQRSV